MDRQRVLMIFVVAWISAAGLTWFLWSRTQAPQKEKTVRVVAAARDMAAGTRLQKGDLRFIAMPEKDLPKAALLDSRIAEGRALLFPVTTNEPVTTPKLSTTTGADGLPATIPQGYRAISVPITDISGVAGLLQPRARVDVLFTRSGAMAEALTTVVVEDVMVLSIGRNTEISQAPAQAQGGASTTTNINPSQQRAVSLLVTPAEAGKLELAKNQGKLSLALRNPLDKSRMEKREAVTAEALDPELFTRVRRPTVIGGRPGAAGRPPVDVRDPNVWAQLTAQDAAPKKAEKKDPPKPRLVVDVYRGDKHTQETFHQ